MIEHHFSAGHQRRNAPRITRPLRVPKVCQTVAFGHPHPAGASLQGASPLRRSTLAGIPALKVRH
jgi:hypothetical protein